MTEDEHESECKYKDKNPIEVSLQLSYADIQSIVDMMNWADYYTRD